MRRILLAERPLVYAVLLGFGLWIVIQLLLKSFWVFVLIALSLLAATAMMPVVRLVESARLPPRAWRIPRPAAALLIYLAGGAAFGLSIFGIQALVRDDVVHAIQTTPDMAASLAQAFQGMAASLGISGIIPDPADITGEVRALLSRASDALALTVTALGGIIGFFFRLFLVLTLALFLIIEADDFTGFVLELFPPDQRGRVAGIAASIGDKIGRLVLGQLAVGLIAGLLAGAAAAFLGLPYPVLIGLGTLLLDLAPAVGPGLMAIPVFFLGMSQSPLLAVVGALVFLGLSQLDGNVLSPIITGKASQLSPAIVIIAITIGVALYGLLGAIISVPVAMAIHVFIEEVIRPWLYDKYKTSKPAPPEG